MFICLERLLGTGIEAIPVGKGVTNADGRCPSLISSSSSSPLIAGTYRITFETGPYLLGTAGSTFYPEASIVFQVKESQTQEHFHIPLLLSPFGYSTYRGS